MFVNKKKSAIKKLFMINNSTSKKKKPKSLQLQYGIRNNLEVTKKILRINNIISVF